MLLIPQCIEQGINNEGKTPSNQKADTIAAVQILHQRTAVEHRSQDRARCVGNNVGHTRISGRKKRLQDLYRKTDDKSREDGSDCWALPLLHRGKIDRETESYRYKTRDV